MRIFGKKRMTKLCALLFAMLMLLTSCATPVTTTAEQEDTKTKEEQQQQTKPQGSKVPQLNVTATAADIAALDERYAGRNVYQGELHCHSDSGTMGDGEKTLGEWQEMVVEKNLDFATIVDHRQVAHWYEEKWDTSKFIFGTEISTSVSDSLAQHKTIHHNLILPGPESLLRILDAFPQFAYTGGKNGVGRTEGKFDYPKLISANICKIIDMVKEEGGLWVHVHPKQKMESNRALDFYFADYTGLEIFYLDPANKYMKENYKLWTELLAMGKRIWATSGSDTHKSAKNTCLTTIYSEAQQDTAFLSHLAKGDFVCGDVGIRMMLGDANMGGHTDFQGKRVVLSIGDIYPERTVGTFMLKIITDQGTVHQQMIDLSKTTYLAFDADENAAFYRVEIHNLMITEQPIIALGNPIWND